MDEKEIMAIIEELRNEIRQLRDEVRDALYQAGQQSAYEAEQYADYQSHIRTLIANQGYR